MFPIFKSVDRQRWLYFWHALLSLMYFVLCCPLALSDVDYYVLGFFGSITEWVPSISDTANLAANPTGARFVLSICWVWGLIMFIPVLYVFFVEPGEFELSHFSGLSWPYSVGSVFFLFFFPFFLATEAPSLGPPGIKGNFLFIGLSRYRIFVVVWGWMIMMLNFLSMYAFLVCFLKIKERFGEGAAAKSECNT